MKNKTSLYPLKFKPQLIEKVWGGNNLNTVLGKKSNQNNIGESWEISTVDENVSIINNGSLKDKTLTQVIKIYKEQLLGKKVYKKYKDFPLLFKYIDAKQDLSIQVHPDDAVAQKKHQSFGKTEMWYVINTEEDAKLYLGFKNDITSKKYSQAHKNKTLVSTLNIVAPKKGDSFFVPPGTVHAIGGGVLLAEIQQKSDITYRIYDWDRPDKSGEYRTLHNELAKPVINYNAFNEKAIKKSDLDSGLLYECSYFKTSKIILNHSLEKNYETTDSFVVFMCVGGAATVTHNDIDYSLFVGETILIPAICKNLTLLGKQATILEIIVP